jgi:mono/diheme cytochrome c family protein
MRNSGLLAIAVVALGAMTLMANEKPPEAYSNAMKAVQAANMSLRGNVTAKNYDGIAKDAASLKTAFSTVEQWWTAKKVDDAVTAAKAAVKGASDLETAATAKSDEGIAAAQRAIGGTCMGCHTAHRERLPDGTFEIK